MIGNRILGAAVFLCVRRWWPEAVYLGCAAAMSLCCGTLDGVPRYTIVLFPVFVVLSGLRRWPVLCGLFVVASILLQAFLLVNFVRFGNPLEDRLKNLDIYRRRTAKLIYVWSEFAAKDWQMIRAVSEPTVDLRVDFVADRMH